MEQNTFEFLFALGFGVSVLVNISLIIYFLTKDVDKTKKEKPFGKYRHWDED